MDATVLSRPVRNGGGSMVTVIAPPRGRHSELSRAG